MSVQIKMLSDRIDIQSSIDWVMSDEAGGIDVFIGTVRNETRGRRVIRLEFEAYEPMALHELEKIVQQAFEKWQARARVEPAEGAAPSGTQRVMARKAVWNSSPGVNGS